MTGPDQRRPHALVVVESMFGNTEQVARAVAAGLADGGVDAVGRRRGRGAGRPACRGGPPGPRLPHARVLDEPAHHPGGRGAAGRPARTGGHRAARVAGQLCSPRTSGAARSSPSSTRASRRYDGCPRPPDPAPSAWPGAGDSRCSVAPRRSWSRTSPVRWWPAELAGDGVGPPAWLGPGRTRASPDPVSSRARST